MNQDQTIYQRTAQGETALMARRSDLGPALNSLLVPTEEEALTVRATRDALAKLDANPERLLG